jgi:hypothetical protein
MMKVKIVVEDVTQLYGGRRLEFSRSQIWEGELDLLDDNVYITKVSIIAEGHEHPICDIPFSMDTGHWLWVPELHAIPRRFAEPIVDADELIQAQGFTITEAAQMGPDLFTQTMERLARKNDQKEDPHE